MSNIEPVAGTRTDDERIEAARSRVREIKGLYIHVAIYVLVNVGLHIINFVTAPGQYWAFWPLLGWGIGVAAHILAVARIVPFLGKEWEERKVQQVLDKDAVRIKKAQKKATKEAAKADKADKAEK